MPLIDLTGKVAGSIILEFLDSSEKSGYNIAIKKSSLKIS
jgi:hypothetical protein